MTSHIKQMKAQYAANRERVLQLLGWDMLQYATLQYETGLQYLRSYLQMDDATARMFEASPRWWNWWVNQWNLRDAQVFLPEAAGYSKNAACKAYKSIHSIAYLDGRYPHAHLMDDSYNAMSKQVYRDLKKQDG